MASGVWGSACVGVVLTYLVDLPTRSWFGTVLACRPCIAVRPSTRPLLPEDISIIILSQVNNIVQ